MSASTARRKMLVLSPPGSSKTYATDTASSLAFSSPGSASASRTGVAVRRGFETGSGQRRKTSVTQPNVCVRVWTLVTHGVLSYQEPLVVDNCISTNCGFG